MINKRYMTEYLRYLVENCETAVDELNSINKRLRTGMGAASDEDVKHLGALNRMIQDYLIGKVTSLFDKDSRTISFVNIFPDNDTLKSILKEPIIERFKENRDRLVAHSDSDFINKGEYIIPTNEICSSNLGEILKRLKTLLD